MEDKYSRTEIRFLYVYIMCLPAVGAPLTTTSSIYAANKNLSQCQYDLLNVDQKVKNSI